MCRFMTRLAALIFLLGSVVHAAERSDGNVARVVVWQPKPGLEREFEEGYKRHLQWHRANRDPWAWYGWAVRSGTQDGYFVDGTFFRQWTELDSPVAPAADAADNRINVFPYADVRSSAIYESIPALSNFDRELLSAPLMTFYRFDLLPGAAAEFESAAGAALRSHRGTAVQYAMLRPVNGVTSYLLLVPGKQPSDFASQSEFVQRLLGGMRRAAKGKSAIVRFSTETAAFRPDLSYMPDF